MATATIATRPPLPPFSRETAVQKVRLAEDSWNSRDPGKVALAYAIDSRWRNRSEFINGRNEIIAFLTRKWVRESSGLTRTQALRRVQCQCSNNDADLKPGLNGS